MNGKDAEAIIEPQQSCELRVAEFHEQGYPEIIEVNYKGEWFRYVHSRSELELKMNKYIKENFHGII
jgi:hypothetical protein